MAAYWKRHGRNRRRRPGSTHQGDAHPTCPRCWRSLAVAAREGSPCYPDSGWCGVYGQREGE